MLRRRMEVEGGTDGVRREWDGRWIMDLQELRLGVRNGIGDGFGFGVRSGMKRKFFKFCRP